VVDEVLAVGDAEFQRKCLGKMQNVSKSEGRTVLFVSHNMSAIESLCNRIIFVNEGKILYDGEAGYGIKVYINHSQNLPHATNIVDRKDRKGNGLAIITDFKICDDSGIITNNLLSGHNYTFEIVYKNVTNENIKNIYVSIDLLDEKGSNVLLFKNTFTNDSISLRKETGSVFCRVDNLPITVGSYSFALYLSIADRETLDYLDNAFSITVTGGDFFGTGNVGVPSNCKVLTKHKWYQ
jgi:lipopolysaccharide transport system ATP-binding protein